MKLTLVVDNLHMLRWWVNVSYGKHSNLKGHTGMMMSLGEGATMVFLRGQKLNARRSTIAELIGVDDAIPDITWRKHFIKAKGYTVTSNILYQDNQSCILLATNGCTLSSRRTKHIHHRYFLVKNLVDHGELEVRYIPTNHMWSDVLTKSLMGIKWREMRAKLMNFPVNYDDEVKRWATHPGLLSAKERGGLPQGTLDCVKKTGVVTTKKAGVAKPDEVLAMRVTTGPDKMIS